MNSATASHYYKRYPLKSEKLLDLHGSYVMIKILEQTQEIERKKKNIILNLDSRFINQGLVRGEIIKLGNLVVNDLSIGDVVFYDRYAAYGMPPTEEHLNVILAEENIIFKE